MAYWRSCRPLILAITLVASVGLLSGRAFGQEHSTGTETATGAAQEPAPAADTDTATGAAGTQTSQPPGEFKRDLPMEVADAPPPPLVRPQGSFFAVAAGQGGPIFWVLVVLGIGALLVAIERFLSLSRGRADLARFMAEVSRGVSEKGVNGGLEICSRNRGPVAQVVAYGLQRSTRGPEGVEKAVNTAAISNGVGMRRGMGILNFVAQTAPLIGFLGTVMGLLHSFDAALDSGSVNAAQAIGGISEAVVTTTTGIGIAIIVNVFINLISARIDRLSVQMEEAGDELVDIMVQNQGRLKGRTA